ncbi:MAG TPA: hypothetical protein DCQ64_12360 [Candidatus Rokubacteria bacterium]|nr:hypothetical protein [Candidatus Rokubacteria bacterium]
MRDLDSIEWFEPKLMRTYPHLLSMDAQVWEAFLRGGLYHPQRVAYDVHVGTPVPLPSQATDMEHRVADGLTRKRIDVVLDFPDQIWVAEIKPFGNHMATGQALQYHQLFTAEYSTSKAVLPVILCFAHDPDLTTFTSRYPVTIIDVPIPDGA